MDFKRITLFADDAGDHPSADYAWVDAWLERWKDKVRVVDYSSGGWEHLWDVEAPAEAVTEVPEHLLCTSVWSNPEIGRSSKDVAVETAKQILCREIGIVEGCVRMSRLAHAVVLSWAEDPDFVVFGALSSETDHLPINSVRQYWSAKALAAADAEITRIESDAREAVERACRNIVERFSDPEQAISADHGERRRDR